MKLIEEYVFFLPRYILITNVIHLYCYKFILYYIYNFKYFAFPFFFVYNFGTLLASVFIYEECYLVVKLIAILNVVYTFFK